MGKRKRIATILSSYTAATGVTIYLINLIKHFKALEDQKKPELIIVYNNESPIEEVKEIGYPYATYINSDKQPFILVRVVNRLRRMIFNTIPTRYIQADYLYPALEDPKFSKIKNKIFWKEDFQECYMPENFTPGDLKYTKNFFEVLHRNPQYDLVLSSQASKKDLYKFYGNIDNSVHILRFVSLIPKLDDKKIPELIKRYHIEKPYFIVCNQFWPHKNHSTVIEAVSIIAKQGYDNFTVVFTGKTTSHRNKDYYPRLEQSMEQLGIKDRFITTGFLQREDQLLLMKNAIAVVQPSLFEGWSTVIEDAKALNRYVIASDLDVNMEQLNDNVSFFERKDAAQLAALMKKLLLNPPIVKQKDYEQNIQIFRNDLVNLFEL